MTAWSLLDLAQIGTNETALDSFNVSVTLARRAETGGLTRVWYAEHHNMPSIASSATSVLIAHIAAHTTTIRLGAGGVMLPNHAPLLIAEQFGTLETLHPGRIDLGLGRAPGSDQATMRALRRDAHSADRFPADVAELQGYLTGNSHIPGIQAVPGNATNVPLYILGSSTFGAQLAAKLGLPYAFASHFAPRALLEAVALYRKQFQPSDQLASPYVIAGMNVIAAADRTQAQARLQATRRARVRMLFKGMNDLNDAELDTVLDSPAGAQVDEMLRYTTVGDSAEVAGQIDAFAEHARADEVILALADVSRDDALESFDRVATIYESR